MSKNIPRVLRYYLPFVRRPRTTIVYDNFKDDVENKIKPTILIETKKTINENLIGFKYKYFRNNEEYTYITPSPHYFASKIMYNAGFVTALYVYSNPIGLVFWGGAILAQISDNVNDYRKTEEFIKDKDEILELVK